MVCCFLLVAGCDRTAEVETDFIRAEKAYEKRDIADAEMYYERFLRLNQVNPKRWYVWQQLLDIAINYRQDKTVARSYLELMLEEFFEDASRRLTIEKQLADVAAELKDYSRALGLWENLVNTEAVPPEDKAHAYRKLSGAYLRQLDFSAATEGLELCLQLPITDEIKVDCLYDLAVTQTLTDALPEAQKSFETLIAMKGVNTPYLVVSVFLLADVYEQEEKYDKALGLYESIRETYPNPQVIAMRILNLQKKLKK